MALGVGMWWGFCWSGLNCRGVFCAVDVDRFVHTTDHGEGEQTLLLFIYFISLLRCISQLLCMYIIIFCIKYFGVYEFMIIIISVIIMIYRFVYIMGLWGLYGVLLGCVVVLWVVIVVDCGRLFIQRTTWKRTHMAI